MPPQSEPLRTLYLLWVLWTIGFVFVPIWSVKYLIKSMRPVPERGWLESISVSAVYRGNVIAEMGYALLGRNPTKYVDSSTARNLIKYDSVDACISVEYRSVNRGCFPTQLVDALSAYNHLVDVKGIDAKRIVLCGDSAGANLALALTRYLRDEGVLPMPRGLFLLSPWVDMSWAWPEGPKQGEEPSGFGYAEDIIDMNTAGKYCINNFVGAANSPLIVSSPYVSPASQNLTSDELETLFSEFPKTFIHSAKAEVLHAEIMRLKERMKNCGVDVTSVSFKAGAHDILILPAIFFGGSARRKRFWQGKAKTWFDEVFEGPV
ncbi:uncharacterized protein L969DRAFT_105609 [Mixia osmundae IAM 14324]|uniref:Alpha/beta hydrolase fold-3 domain-containing protein n=1 Tax=Mixia osmundae (strain CBS 9802 / IAM 14324 / JCM 22182 / KY 12970) TaxID=764103 RepID=G7E2I8_MIXOS|nr:uncharacterized protein L969DRAFT_105609 [Mixia osmundae IAM 14324]KEI36920.1 hypothetical protein L969DRAFT_105609 [Mixia osmundae IAM 14324]GAA97048.1 hypothetical protein E5Q_03723 [Mixia osmundae IAM 14324]